MIYRLLIVFIAGLVASLPFLHADIAVRARGIMRPVQERTELKSLVTGIIDTLLCKEGDTVEKNAVILRIRDEDSKGRRQVNSVQLQQRESFVHELRLLTGTIITRQLVTGLESPWYRQQALRFIHQRDNLSAALSRADKDLQLNTILAREKIISANEFFDTGINRRRVESEYRAFLQEQLSQWQKDLAVYTLELSQLRQQLERINYEAAGHEIRAPVAGVIQGMGARYAGGSVEANETVCLVSPGGDLLAECYVSSTDIGLLHADQPVKLQIDAFNYTWFGIITGRIIAIDNDFTLVDNVPVFKVKCLPDKNQLRLKNGFTGQLKKGLTLQARFLVARRSLWQLLFDKLDDWLNPAGASQ